MRWALFGTCLCLFACGQKTDPATPIRASYVPSCSELIKKHIDSAPTCQKAQELINAEPLCQSAFRRPINLDCR